jgi:ATP-dependent Zn protease
MGGAANLVAKVLADEPSRTKVDSILSTTADRVACMILEHRTALIAIADELCERDELSGDDISRIVGSQLPA